MPIAIVLPALTERVTVREIPELLAWALYPEAPDGTPEETALNQQILWHAAVEDYTKEVRAAVMRGELTPRASLTRLPIPQAIGEQLLDAFVTVENLMEYAARHSIILSVGRSSLIALT